MKELEVGRWRSDKDDDGAGGRSLRPDKDDDGFGGRSTDLMKMTNEAEGGLET
jgi:hypothetical protein